MKVRTQRKRFYAAHKDLYSTQWRRRHWYSCKGYKLIPMEIGIIDRFRFITSNGTEYLV